MNDIPENIQMSELQKYSIFVACPMYGGMCTANFTKSMIALTALCQANGIQMRFYSVTNESLVQRARNFCTEMFLQSGMTHMVFVDADIDFDANDILVMLGIQVTDPETYNVLAGAYPKKVIAWEQAKAVAPYVDPPTDISLYSGDFVFNLVPGAKFSLEEPFEVMEAGTGFMLIPRDILTKYAETYKDQEYRPDHKRTEHFNGSKMITAFFDCKIDEESKRYLSEDYFFCQNVRKMGGKIHIIPWIRLSHVGTYTYKGDLAHVGQALQLISTEPGV